MVNREDCKYFYYKNKKLRGFNNPTPDFQTMPMCKIRKMTVGGCHEDCEWFKPK